MEPNPESAPVLRFGVFDLDLARGELRKAGVRQKLRGQPFEVLRALLERPQQVVTREELRRRLWPENTFINSDLALKKAINRIREVLGDSAESPRFIETIPRRGYRFLAEVEVHAPEAKFTRVGGGSVPSIEASPKVIWRRSAGALAIIVILIGATLSVIGIGRWGKVKDRPAVGTTDSQLSQFSALEAYLEGKHHLKQFSRGFGDEEKKSAAESFERALNADPGFAPAYVGISEAHLASLEPFNEDIRLETQAAERAIDLDPSLSDAWETLAYISFNSWNWQAAEQAYRRAIRLNPDNAVAHEGLCHLLDATGHMDSGMAECELAQRLDPGTDHISYALLKRHEYDRAINILVLMLRTDPSNGYLHHKLFEAYASKGMYEQAVQQLARTARLFKFAKVADDVQTAYANAGYKAAIREYASDLEQLSESKQVFLPVNIAAAYAALDDKDRAFYWLEEAYTHRGYVGAGVPLSEVNVYPLLDPLRPDQRFKDLTRRMGLPTS